MKTNSEPDGGRKSKAQERFLGIGGWMVVLACFLAVACGEYVSSAPTSPEGDSSKGRPAVSSARLVPFAVTLEVGESAELELDLFAEDGSSVHHKSDWTVADPTVAELKGGGSKRKVTGLSGGSTVVVATADGVSDSTTVTVKAEEPALSSVKLTPASLSVEEGATAELTLEVTASDGTTTETSAEWTVEDPSLVELMGDGRSRKVKGLKSGRARVVASVEGMADTTLVDVTSSTASTAPAMPEELSVTEEERTDTAVLYRATWSASDDAGGYDWSAGSDGGLWSDADSASGLETTFEGPRSGADDPSYFCVRAVNAAGESDQRCTDFIVPATSVSDESFGSGGGTSDTTVASVIVLPETPSIEVGRTVDLTATAKNASGDVVSASFDWSSLDPAVATVDGSGLVTGQADGTAGIVAITDGVADTATVTVTAASSGSGGSGGPAVVFDPDRYSSTQELKDDPYGVFSSTELGGNYHLDTQVGYPDGSHSMRYDWVDQGADNAVSIGRRIPLPSRAKEVWIEFYARWSTNFMCCIDMSQTATYAHKFVFGEVKTTNSQPWLLSNGESVYRWSLHWPGGGAANPPNGSLKVETPTTTFGSQVHRNLNQTNAADYFDGQWHQVRIHWRHDPGLYEIWIDGVKVLGLDGYTVDPEIDLTAVLLGRNKDDGNPSGTESLWWGKVTIWTGNSSW